MKKILLFVACIAISFGAFAQIDKGEKTLVIEGGVKSNPGRFMLGAQARYNIIDHIRIAPEALFVFPKDKTMGIDINANLHYVFELRDVASDLYLYPLIGISMQNARYAGGEKYTDTHDETIKETKSNGTTQFGCNLGAGIEYNVSNTTFLNLEAKYTFSDSDCFNILVGYGFKF